MAHLVSEEVFTPGFMGKEVTTEVGKTLKDYTLEDVQFILHLLAYNNTRISKTVTELERDYGLIIHPITLRRWVSSHFTERYVQIQHELEGQINKKLAPQLTDVASRAVEATGMTLTEGMANIANLKPNELSAAAKNYADVASKSIEKAALLNDQPTHHIKHSNPDEALETLRKLGLLRDEEPKIVQSDAEVLEED